MSEVMIAGDLLFCPLCEGNLLHQEYVKTYWREEDCESVETVSSIDGITVGYDKGRRNPSNRRSGLRIGFSCEECSGEDMKAIVELTIAQHKGITYIKWEVIQ